MPRTVQLRHDLPDGSWHIDWMIELEQGGGGLATFRLPRRVDDLCAGESVEALRLEDHRRAYLDYEGPVSGGRGTVRRLASGRISRFGEGAGHWLLDVEWDPRRRQRLCLHRAAGDTPRWVVQALDDDASGAGLPGDRDRG
jgi:hypothetical protein